jgi:hypothetical protein
MDHFGLKTVKDLPKLKDLHIADNEIGMPSDLMDVTEIPVDAIPESFVDEIREGLQVTLQEDVEESASGEFIVEGTVDASSAEEGLEQDLQGGEDQSDPSDD